MKNILSYFFLLVLVLATGLFLANGYYSVYQVIREAFEDSLIILLLTMLVYFLVFRKRMRFINNLIHEFTHMLFSFLTFSRVEGLYVSTTSGIVYSGSAERKMVVAIAPYFFSLPTVLLIGLFSLIEFKYDNQAVLASYVVFLLITIENLIKAPSDISESGIRAAILLLVLNFWSFYLLLTWCSMDGIQFHEILITIKDAISGTLSQIRSI